MGLLVFWPKPRPPLARVDEGVYTGQPMSELIRNLEEAMEEMSKIGNEKGLLILEKAIRQANKILQNWKPPS